MNPRTLATVAVKILAIYLITQGIMEVTKTVTLYSAAQSSIEIDKSIVVFFTSAIFIPLLAGVALWFASGTLSKLILKNTPDSESPSMPFSDVHAAVISTIGLFVVVDTVPQLARATVQLFGEMDIVNNKEVYNSGLLAMFSAICVQIALGVSLMLGASGWVNLLYKFRGLGLK